MENAGIDTRKFKPHSTRAASTSAAKIRSVPKEDILLSVGWKSGCTFVKYNLIIFLHA